MTTDTSSPAFPCGRDVTLDQFAPSSGLSMRDYFAAKAMQGFLAAGLPLAMAYETVAHRAYRLAEAMLEARN